MPNKKGEVVLSDVFSILFTVILLIMIVAFSFLDMTKDKINIFDKDGNKIEVKDVSYGNENIFVINSYLNTQVDSYTFSDLINLYLKDKTKEKELETKTKIIFDKVYGKCYGFEISTLKINSLSDKKVCVDYQINEKLCLDISEYDDKMKNNKVIECFE